jgi:hypothetical protein
MKLNEISFPVYRLGKRKPIMEEGVSFYLSMKELDDGKIVYFPSVIDDLKIPGGSLGIRRMKLLNSGEKLFRLKYAAFFISDMLKLSNGATWFIDTNGKIFEYKKTKRVPLIFRKIVNVERIRTGGAIIQVEGISTRFKSLYSPKIEHRYAGLLQVSGGYLLYGFYDTLYDKTTRSI